VPVISAEHSRSSQLRGDAAVLGHRLLHDDDGRAWRGWFAAANLAGFDAVRHQYFSDYSLAIAAALQGQGALLGAAAFIQPELRSGRLVQLGRTRVSFGSYWLLESRERSTATLRAAFCRWIDAEVRKS